MRVVKQEELEGEEDCYMGVAALFNGLVYSKLSEFQRRVRRVLKVGRMNNLNREPIMKGKALGCSTNNFVADAGSSVAIMPLSAAERNRLEVIPADKDEPSYEGVTGMRLSVVGQTTMYINFKTMKTTRSLAPLAWLMKEVLVDLETLIEWGIIPERIPLPIDINDRVGGMKDTSRSFQLINVS